MDPEALEQLKQPTVSVKVAASLVNLGANAVYRAIAAGKMPSIKIGGAIRVPTAPLRKMLGIEA